MMLFDIYLEGSFYCQLKYKGLGNLSMDDQGNIVQTVSVNEMRQYVEEKLPTFRGKKFSFYQTKNRVFK